MIRVTHFVPLRFGGGGADPYLAAILSDSEESFCYASGGFTDHRGLRV